MDIKPTDMPCTATGARARKGWVLTTRGKDFERERHRAGRGKRVYASLHHAVEGYDDPGLACEGGDISHKRDYWREA